MDQTKSKQCHFDEHRFSASLMYPNLSEIALSRLDTQQGFRDNTPVEAGGEFAYAGILIEELCAYVLKSAP
jgi:hypothetical protein